MNESPTIFDSFNARALQPLQVARTFVPSIAFARLCRRRHTVVLGPRGSGKTTLLKMLQVPAVNGWQHPEADEFIRELDFIGVYVPFDRSWRAQLDRLGSPALDADARKTLGRAAFTTHVLRALLQTFLCRISPSSESVRQFGYTNLSTVQQVSLCRELRSVWRLEAGGTSIRSVMSSLGARLSRIAEIAEIASTFQGTDRLDTLRRHEFLFGDFLELLSTALDVWESVVGVSERWGLLFDELELAPRWTQQELYDSLRSRDQRILLKLALSPYSDEIRVIRDRVGPQHQQDYEELHLFHANKRTGAAFCRALLSSMLLERGLPDLPPEVVFGRSRFETPLEEWQTSPGRTAYGGGSRLQKRFAALAAIDQSFDAYLEARDIRVEALDVVSATQRAADIRKIAPIVEARYHYLRRAAVLDRSLKESPAAFRSRRTSIYSGWDSLCAVSEGNPRWFIGIVGGLLEDFAPRKRRIPRSLQAQAIERATNRLRAALRTVPVDSVISREKTQGLLSLLDTVGSYFERELFEKGFAPEPPATFRVEAEAPEALVEAVGQALNAGALIFVADHADQELLLTDLREKRFRLSYLLAAHHGLLLRLGRPVGLQRILAASGFADRDTIQLPLGA